MIGESTAVEILDNESFIKSYESRRFWRGKIDSARVQTLFSWDHLNHALSTSRITNDRLRLSTKDGHVDQNRQAFRRVKDRFGRPTDALSIPDLQCLIGQGVTGVLEAVTELSPNARTISEMIASRYYARSSANAYFSFGKTSGFGAHNDDHDVIVIQLEGRKNWRFFGAPTIASMATVEHLTTPTDEDVSEEITLDAGDVVFVPKGTWHDVISINEPSLHVTFSVVYPTLRNYMEWLLSRHPERALGQDVRLFDGPLSGAVQICSEFLGEVVNDQSMATFLDDYYSKYPAIAPRPTFPSLNRPSLTDRFIRIPFTFTNIKPSPTSDTNEGVTILTLGKSFTLSSSEHRLLSILSHQRATSGMDLIELSAIRNEHAAAQCTLTSLENLLDLGLISKA